MRYLVHGLLFLLLLVVTPAWAVPNTWSPTGDMSVNRVGQTATLLPSGKVLVAGGNPSAGIANGSATATAELYDPVTGLWSATASMSVGRGNHTATLLPSGLVLVVGGDANFSASTAELYNPATGLWTLTGAPSELRLFATATLLPSGKVLLAGGFGVGGGGPVGLATVELYEPSTGQWTATGTMNVARTQHAATLLPSGKVLVSGGSSSFGGSAGTSAELYDSTSGQWTATGSMNVARASHSATLLANGKVLAADSFNESGSGPGSAELYDPTTGLWTSTTPMIATHLAGSAVLLPSGQVLVAGGVAGSTCEIFDPTTGHWSATGAMSTARGFAAMTLLPSGQLLIAGGTTFSSGLMSAEVYDPANGHWSAVLGAMGNARQGHTATALPSGKVLVAGGASSGLSASAELYEPATQQWAATAAMNAARTHHTATLLASGKVLVAGGNSSGPNAELYAPATGLWATTGAMSIPRQGHTATLLPSGKVLVSGGTTTVAANSATAEIYDPASGQWRAAGTMQSARAYHTATLLPSGKVLVVGGINILGAGAGLASAELYDPATGQWTPTGPLSAQREFQTATLLPNGKVLVAGGYAPQNSSYPTLCELYDPSTGSWTTTGVLGEGRSNHTATLLSSGRVLVAGGGVSPSLFTTTALSSSELYDPLTGLWTTIEPLDARYSHSATLLPYGVVLLAGGATDANGTPIATAIQFDAGLAPVSGPVLHSVRHPILSSVPALITQGGSLTATSSGSSANPSGVATSTGFMPRLEGNVGQSQNSAGNSPVFQVQRLDNEQMRFLRNDETLNMTDMTFVSAADTLLDFPPGPLVVRVWVNGVPSASLPATLRSDRIFADGFGVP